MFARDKRIGPYTYVYLVENVREEGRTKQSIIANLGRKEVVVARGDLDRLARSVVRLAQRSMVLSLVEGEAPPKARCQRIGPALLFERLWHEVGCRAVLEELAAGRQFEFVAERAVFLTVLHRLFVSGSDRAAELPSAEPRVTRRWLSRPRPPRCCRSSIPRPATSRRCSTRCSKRESASAKPPLAYCARSMASASK